MNNTATSELWSQPFFTRLFVIAMAATLCVVAVFNLAIDPFELYGTGLFEPLQFNRYEKKLELYRNLQPAPQVIILGSSRVEPIDPETVFEITGKRCFNWAQPSATAETLLAALNLALERPDENVDTMIIAVDPMVFHPSGWIHGQARLAPEYTRYFSIDPIWANLRERILRLTTFEQTKSSLNLLRRAVGLDKSLPMLEFRDDGFAIYPQRQAEYDSGEFDLRKVLDERVPVYVNDVLQINQFTGLSPERKQLWEEFLEICSDRGIMVYAFMPPVHPQLLDSFNSTGAMPLYDETSEYVESTVTEAGGIYRDYLTVESFGGSPDLFWDEVHMRTENGEALVRALLSSPTH